MRRMKRRDRVHTFELPKFKLDCVFQVEKYKRDGTITYKGPKFHNTILDVGLDIWYDYTLVSITNVLNVGSGSSTPSTAQTGLDSYVDSADSIIDSEYDYNDLYGSTYASLWRKWEFPIGSCTGNLTELGLSKESDSDYFNRQLFRDETGTPVTITVDSDEGLRVDGTVFVYAPMNPGEQITGSFLLNGTDTINYTLEMAFGLDVASYTNGFQAEGIFNFNRSGYKTRLSIDDEYEGWQRGEVVGNDIRQSYSIGSFELIVDTVIAPGDFVGDARRFATGLHHQNGPSPDGTDMILFHFRLENPISIADNEETTVQWKMSWGRYGDVIDAPPAVFYQQGGGYV